MEIVTITMTDFSYYIFAVLGLVGFIMITYFLFKSEEAYKWNSYKFEYHLLLLLPIYWIYFLFLIILITIFDSEFAFSGLLILYWTTLLAVPMYLFFLVIMFLLRFLRINVIGK